MIGRQLVDIELQLVKDAFKELSSCPAGSDAWEIQGQPAPWLTSFNKRHVQF